MANKRLLLDGHARAKMVNSRMTLSDEVILPFLRGLGRRIYAAIFSFWTGVIPPLPMLGRS